MRAIVAAASMLGSAAAVAREPRVGDVAPDAVLRLVDGGEVRLADLKGQVVVLNFWATWCVPCREELPLLDRYYALQRTHGLRVFAITTEGSLPVYRLKPLFAKLAITPARGIRGPYDVIGAVPTNYIIDRRGVIRYAKAAALDLDALNRELVPLLNERQ